MVLGILIMATATLAQGNAPARGVVYEVYYTADGRDLTVYGAVREVSAGHFEVTVDEPWQANPRRFFVTARDMVGFEEEDPAHRQRRHERGWEEAGYVLVNTAYGPKPVPRNDAELAQRAQAMADAVAAEQPALTPAPETSAPDPVAGPGFWEQWWAHAIIALVTLLVLAAIAATLIFR